jgi:hypothetical protein
MILFLCGNFALTYYLYEDHYKWFESSLHSNSISIQTVFIPTHFSVAILLDLILENTLRVNLLRLVSLDLPFLALLEFLGLELFTKDV